VVLSTQKNGIIHPAHPSLSRFNYAIAMLRVEDEVYLMDATDPDAGINLLPVRCLNDKGRVIGSNELTWISLMDYATYKYQARYTLALNENMELSGSRVLKLQDYGSYKFRGAIRAHGDLERYEKELNDRFEGVTIKNMKAEDYKGSKNQLTLSYDVIRSDYAEDAGDMLLFTPVYDPFIEENPFKLEKREYPVEFDYPYSVMQVYSITLPEGYTISELPKPMILRMPDNSAKYTYQIVPAGNKLMITTSFMLKRSQYLPREYENIKSFYQMIVDKQNELVVLEKI
jgi:hypothetical protein